MSLLTKKQTAIIKLILTSYSRGEDLDIDQLKTALGNNTTKQALQCSIRFLEKKDIILRTYECRRFRLRLVLQPTVKCLSITI